MLRPLIGTFFLGIMLGGLSIQAAEFYEPISSIRQNGMGGVYIFDKTDATSFLQNPAYTCYLKGINWAVVDLGGGVNGLQVYKDVTNSSTTINGYDSLTSWYGKRVWLGLEAQSTFTLPCFGMSVWDSGSLSMVLHTPTFPSLYAQYINDYTFQIGGGFPLGDRLSFGISAKRVTRKGGDLTFGVETLDSIDGSTITNSFLNEGVAWGLDAGLVARAENVLMNPTMSLMWRDVGSTAFQMTKGTSAPDRQRDNLILGLTLDGHVPLLGWSAGLEYRHILENGEPITKKLHLGTEINLALLDLRAGFYQGYTSYGVGIDLALFQLDASMYSVERGAYAGQTEDQRIQVGLSMNLSFDPDFKLIEMGGKGRKLKQRR